MRGISIIICCHNSASRLPQTLKYIAAQEVPQSIVWEIILVNNASTDNTEEVAKREWKKYSCNAFFQIVDQPIPGLSAAREKGIEVSAFEYVLFCDDDNWLDKNYVNIAFETMESHPDAAIVGGQSEGFFDIDKPFWFDSFSQSFAVFKPLPKSGYLTKEKGYLAGAGMIVRKNLFKLLESINFKPLLTDRKGNNLTSGGDEELCIIAKILGFNLYFNEKLKLVHYMPQSRLAWHYFLQMTILGQAIAEQQLEIYYLLRKQANNHFFSQFTYYYLYSLIKCSYQLIFPFGIKKLLFFNILWNYKLLYIEKSGSILQLQLLSAKNKLNFLLKNRKKLKKDFIYIQTILKNINYQL